MRTLAIGDIHGCHTALVNLLKEVKPAPDDQLIFLGDYIDRGPATRQVIDTLIQLPECCSPIFLRGNHEAMLLEAREDALKDNSWQSCGGFETLISYGAEYSQDWAALIPETHWRFFSGTDRFFETEKHIFVHACLDPDLDLMDQPDWVLFWESFDHLRPHKSGKQVICGHTSQHPAQIKDAGFGICIDTAAVFGGWLTCLDVNTGDYWQTDEEGERRTGKL